MCVSPTYAGLTSNLFHVVLLSSSSEDIFEMYLFYFVFFLCIYFVSSQASVVSVASVSQRFFSLQFLDKEGIMACIHFF